MPEQATTLKLFDKNKLNKKTLAEPVAMSFVGYNDQYVVADVMVCKDHELVVILMRAPICTIWVGLL